MWVKDKEVLDLWDTWLDKIPYIQFPEDWLVRAIPPFNGALIRYNVRPSYDLSKWVSVYLDVNNSLGSWPGPYWEVYPIDGDCERCGMLQLDELLNLIQKALDSQ